MQRDAFLAKRHSLPALDLEPLPPAPSVSVPPLPGPDGDGSSMTPPPAFHSALATPRKPFGRGSPRSTRALTGSAGSGQRAAGFTNEPRETHYVTPTHDGSRTPRHTAANRRVFRSDDTYKQHKQWTEGELKLPIHLALSATETRMSSTPPVTPTEVCLSHGCALRFLSG